MVGTFVGVSGFMLTVPGWLCLVSQYTKLLYWRDASLHTLDYCVGGMHLLILSIIWKGSFCYVMFIWMFFSEDWTVAAATVAWSWLSP